MPATPSQEPGHSLDAHSFDGTTEATGRTFGARATVRDLLVDAQRRLDAAGVPSPQSDAAWLMAWVLDVPRNRLFLHDEPDDRARMAFEKALARRLSRVPLQHIVGRAPFRRIDIAVGPGVFIPRPETEVVTEVGVRHLRDLGGGVAVDLCAGSGAIGISLAVEVPGVNVHAVEMDEAALEWLRRNIDQHRSTIAQVGSSIDVVHADATTVADTGGALASLVGRVDAVVANPPYIPDGMIPREVEVRDHDPPVALFAGPDGLSVIRGIVRTAALLLRPGGVLVIEHADVQGPGAAGGGVVGVLRDLSLDETLSSLLPGRPGASLFEGIGDRLDLTGAPRFTVATRSAP